MGAMTKLKMGKVIAAMKQYRLDCKVKRQRNVKALKFREAQLKQSAVNQWHLFLEVKNEKQLLTK